MDKPGIFELNEGKWRASSVFQVYECHFTEFVEKVLDIFRANIGR